MKRSTLSVASYILIGFALTITAFTLGFFASPQAVRTSPTVHNVLLLEKLANR